nr:hypothetical protein [Tanacetum cinerariifolium]
MATWGVGGVSGYCSDEMGVHRNSCGGEGDFGGNGGYWVVGVLALKAFDAFCAKYHIPEEVHPVLPNQNDTIHKRPAGKIRLYIRFFDYSNFRLPLSSFLVDVLRDPAPVEADFNTQDYATLFAYPSSFRKFPEI